MRLSSKLEGTRKGCPPRSPGTTKEGLQLSPWLFFRLYFIVTSREVCLLLSVSAGSERMDKVEIDVLSLINLPKETLRFSGEK